MEASVTVVELVYLDIEQRPGYDTPQIVAARIELLMRRFNGTIQRAIAPQTGRWFAAVEIPLEHVEPFLDALDDEPVVVKYTTDHDIRDAFGKNPATN